MNNEILDITNAKTTVPSVVCDFEKAKKEALEYVETYKNIVITEDNYKSSKADAKKIGGTILDIEKFRKTIKKELEKPIKEFDANCKEIENILSEAKETILLQTDQYDEKIRQEKLEYARSCITEVSEELGLRDEYKSRFVERDFFTNLTTTKKAIKEDIKAQGIEFKAAQDKVDNLDNQIKIVLSTANTIVEQKFNESDFAMLKNKYMSDDTLDVNGFSVEMMAAVNKRKEDEERIKAQAKEKEALRLAEEQRKREEAEKARLEAEAKAKELKEQLEKEALLKKEKEEAEKKKMEELKKSSTPNYHMEISLDGNSASLKAFGAELKTLSEKYGIKFTVLKDKCHPY